MEEEKSFRREQGGTAKPAATKEQHRVHPGGRSRLQLSTMPVSEPPCGRRLRDSLRYPPTPDQLVNYPLQERKVTRVKRRSIHVMFSWFCSVGSSHHAPFVLGKSSRCLSGGRAQGIWRPIGYLSTFAHGRQCTNSGWAERARPLSRYGPPAGTNTLRHETGSLPPA
jgi:hypothetical protein